MAELAVLLAGVRLVHLSTSLELLMFTRLVGLILVVLKERALDVVPAVRLTMVLVLAAETLTAVTPVALTA